MMLPVIGLIIGTIIALLTPLRFPIKYSQYIAIGILAALDCVFGGIRAGLQGTFDSTVFTSGFLVNTALAIVLTMVGDKLGVDLVLGATVAFSIRIFTNVGIIRRHILDKWFKKPTGKEESPEIR